MPQDIAVPWQLPVQLGTRQYKINPAKYSRQDLPALRQQVDQGEQAGAQTLSLEGSWARSATDWSFGGGQETFDAKASDERRYGRHSNTQALRLGRIALSSAVQSRSSSRGATGGLPNRIAMCPTWMYWIDSPSAGNIYAADVISGPYSAITPALKLTAPVSGISQLASDGVGTVWAISSADGIYRTTTGSSGGTLTSWSSASAFDGQAIGYCNGRLLIGSSNVISEVSSTPTATVIHTFPSNVVVNGFVGTPGAIFIWTSLGREIYVMDDVDPTGALSPPRVAAVLAEGELINTISQTSGVLLILTSLGVRLAVPAGDGSLSVGDIIQVRQTPSATPSIDYYAAAIYGGFAYITHSYIGGSGLARLDLQNFTGPLAPAVHPLEMEASVAAVDAYTYVIGGQGFNAGQFWVHGEEGGAGHIWGFTPTEIITDILQSAHQKVASGYVYSGWLTFGIIELKQPVVVNVVHEALPTGATVKVSLVLDDGTESDLGTQTAVGSTFTTFEVDPTVIGPQRKFQVKLTLTRGTTDTASPVVESWSVRAMPIPQRQEEILLSIMMYPEVGQGDDGSAIAQDLAVEYDYLAGLRDARTPVDVTVLGRTSKVVVDRVAWPQGEVERINNARDEFVGTLYVRLLTVA